MTLDEELKAAEESSYVHHCFCCGSYYLRKFMIKRQHSEPTFKEGLIVTPIQVMDVWICQPCDKKLEEGVEIPLLMEEE